ncbi:MAG: hypothetical protein GXP45_01780 [bacterium]|nr:hypothetical protein [bacterium]
MDIFRQVDGIAFDLPKWHKCNTVTLVQNFVPLSEAIAGVDINMFMPR